MFFSVSNLVFLYFRASYTLETYWVQLKSWLGLAPKVGDARLSNFTNNNKRNNTTIIRSEKVLETYIQSITNLYTAPTLINWFVLELGKCTIIRSTYRQFPPWLPGVLPETFKHNIYAEITAPNFESTFLELPRVSCGSHILFYEHVEQLIGKTPPEDYTIEVMIGEKTYMLDSKTMLMLTYTHTAKRVASEIPFGLE